MAKIKWIHWSWLVLTFLFLFFRLQNFQGVFTKDGVIINDTDPYYRLHRIDLMLNEHRFYSFHEDHLNYPDGLNVSWPLGLDLLVALPLKLYNSTSHAEIESFCAIIIPFLSLPLLWFSGWLGTFLGGPIFGLLLGLLVTCSSSLIYQTSLGRLDHHFLEATFPVALLMFVLKYMQRPRKFLFVGIILLLGLAPSFAPQGWIIGMLMAVGFLWQREWKFAHDVSKMFFYAFAVSLIPLSFSDRFIEGFISWASFSWWTPFVYLFAAVVFEAIHLFTRKDSKSFQKYRAVLGVFIIVVSCFLFYKNQSGFLLRNIHDAVQSATIKTNTMATTLEARTPFQLSLDNWLHSDMCVLVIGFIAFCFFLLKKRYLFLIGYTATTLFLALFQVRFMTMAIPLLFIIILLFVSEMIEKKSIRRLSKTLLLTSFCLLLIIPFRPFFGLTQIRNTHFYYQPIRLFSSFLNEEVKKHNVNKNNQAILAHWDYGHWLLYYTGLPVVADPFQGPSAYEVLELFTSKGTDELEPFLKKHPSRYLVIESGAQRSMHWLEAVHKDINIYFEKSSEFDHDIYFKTTRAFDDLFMYRFFFELGRGLNNNHPKDWRLIYISPYASVVDHDISALKVFEHVPGATFHVHTKKPYSKLYLLGEILQMGEAFVYQQGAMGSHDFTWTVPYGSYDRGRVVFNGIYEIREEDGELVGKLPLVTEEQVLQGDTVKIQF